jgi:hypothetical protein
VGPPSLLLAAISIVVKKKVSQRYNNSEFDGKCNSNNDGNGSGNDLSLSVL